MKIEVCDNFYYRVENQKEDVFKELNSSKENVLRNNEKINIYSGEWIKIKVNDYIVHCVKPVETIEQIAEKYSTAVEQILKDNNLENSKLFIGQRLKIYNKKPL